MMRFFLACVAMLAGFQPSPLRAAAWTLDKGKVQIIHNAVYYNTESFYDPDGERNQASRFQKLEYNPYMQYGLADGLTFGLSPGLQHVRLDGAPEREQSGIVDIELFLRRRLWREGGHILSVQPLVKIPGPYDGDDAPQLGNGQTDVELRGLWGYGFAHGGQNHFTNLEMAWRKRMEAPGDEIRIDATLGVRPVADVTLLAQAFNTFALDKPVAGSFVAANAADYNLTKLQISAVGKISERCAIQVGVFKNVRSENTGGGGGVLVALWSDF